MGNITARNSMATRRLILEEFEKVQTQIVTNPELWRKLSFEAHRELSEVMGADFMDYPEFEFWFSRFLQGNLDLHHDRSSDPKARSFIDLPVEIFEKIGENVDLEERFQLRNVCKDIRAQVDDWDLKFHEIYYNGANNWDLESRFSDCSVCNFPENLVNRFCHGFYRGPIPLVMSLLKFPKLKVEKLTIREEDEYLEKFIKKLDESNRKLHVKKVEFTRYFYSSKIDLHYMIPGVLEDIKMFLVNPTREEMIKIIESQQCQAAKMVYIDSDNWTSEFPLDALYNCTRFSLYLEDPADGLKANFLKTLMKKGKVQKCVLYISKHRYAESQIMNYFNEPKAMVPNFPSLRRYPIPGTNDFYELECRVERCSEKFVYLERKQ
ncbi:hypothetical protein CRE_25942 [Caenorhabditis remanei]|uniref:F-box domain-containing protein n=1 Tax=Caenorhabditis remanei TaxID=31234 RepID=E3NK14_CAERE|nr:hypothetical protein CRE_25942 [Caenorhabditis remanei]